jgi:uncharacterized protein (TIRG00374 family)
MSQEIISQAGVAKSSGHSRLWLRSLGLLLLAFLLWRLDRNAITETLRRSDLRLVALSVAGIVPLILVKTVRWQRILAAQSIRFALWPALLAYFSSLFAGFLTPGRLGEFVKALHVQRAGAASSATAFASVLADRLFDLYALLAIGAAALAALPRAGSGWTAGLLLAALFLPPLLLLHDGVFGLLQASAMRLHTWGGKLLGPQSWLAEVRAGLRRLTGRELALAVLLTIGAYAMFFGQCYLLAQAVGLHIGVAPVAYAVALGSLVTLLPLSISGLGTREAAMIAYLGAAGVSSETALGFSLLVFATFYVGGGLLGLVAWWLQPLPQINPLRRQPQTPREEMQL